MTLSPQDLSTLRSRLGKRNRRVGGGYEVQVAKKIAAHCGFADWNEAFVKPKYGMSRHDIAEDGTKIRVAGGQRNGDLTPIKQMAVLWYSNDLLGPIEAKHCEDWTLAQLFKAPEKSVLYRYWAESNINCHSDRSIVFFTKSRSLDFVLHRTYLGNPRSAYLSFEASGVHLVVQTLPSFLEMVFPQSS